MVVGDRTKRAALPVFSARPLASVGFAPDQIFVALAAAGVSAYVWSWQVAAVVVLVLIVVVLSYRQVVRLHCSGAGDYEVARTHLGARAGVVVGSALVVDHVVTVAVTTAAAAQYAGSAFEALQGHRTWLAVGAVVVLAAANLRPAGRTGRWLAVPTHAFVAGVGALVVVGLVREYAGSGLADAPTADLVIVATEEGFLDGLGGAALVFVVLRAFASGSALAGGIHALTPHVVDCPKPRTRSAPAVVALLGGLTAALGLGLVLLATITDVRVVGDPQRQLTERDGTPVAEDFHTDPLLGQVGASVFDGFAPGWWFVLLATAAVLLTVAHLSFRGFPRLGLVLAEDRYAPQPLASRGDRLTHRNAVLLLTVVSGGLVVTLGADVDRLVPLYLVGVFVVLGTTQAAMARHWTRQLRTVRDPDVRLRHQIDRGVNLLGVAAAVVVLAVTLLAGGSPWAWLPAVMIVVLTGSLLVLRRHYDRVARVLADAEADAAGPSRVHALVLGPAADVPLALGYARATRPDELQVLTASGPEEVLAEVVRARRAKPDGVVEVFVSEGALARWWPLAGERRLERRLLRVPGVMVSAVPHDSTGGER